uniref:Uncharacterized protein n=1 Tax=Steinernema glaseri TaxID=37863 RepID=A0A1I7ZXV4_9BILA
MSFFQRAKLFGLLEPDTLEQKNSVLSLSSSRKSSSPAGVKKKTVRSPRRPNPKTREGAPLMTWRVSDGGVKQTRGGGMHIQIHITPRHARRLLAMERKEPASAENTDEAEDDVGK